MERIRLHIVTKEVQPEARPLTKALRGFVVKVTPVVIAALLSVSGTAKASPTSYKQHTQSAFHTSGFATIPIPDGLKKIASTMGGQEVPAGIEVAGLRGKKPIITDALVGYTKIDAIGIAYNFAGWNKSKRLQSDYGATIQLNSTLYVRSRNTIYDYLVQNVCFFDAGMHTIGFGDNIWNDGVAYSNKQGFEIVSEKKVLGFLHGKGKVSSNSPAYGYYYATPTYGFATPMRFTLTDRVSGDRLYVGYRIGEGKPVVYDTITIAGDRKDIGFVNSSGNNNNFIDIANVTSLVLGGSGQGSTAVADPGTNVYMALYYRARNGVLTPFSSIKQPNGLATDESFENLTASLSPEGLLNLRTGPVVNYSDRLFAPPRLGRLLRTDG